jgi:hypothetical protein
MTLSVNRMIAEHRPSAWKPNRYARLGLQTVVGNARSCRWAGGPADERAGRDRRGQTTGVSDQTRAEVLDQLRRVIAWEVDAQMGVGRPVEQMPMQIADTLLDHFDVSLKPGADVSDLG